MDHLLAVHVCMHALWDGPCPAAPQHLTENTPHQSVPVDSFWIISPVFFAILWIVGLAIIEDCAAQLQMLNVCPALTSLWET